MLQMSEHHCPWCERKVFVVAKLGGEFMFTVLIDEFEYKSIVMLESYQERLEAAGLKLDWKKGKHHNKLIEVIDESIARNLMLNLEKVNDKVKPG